MKLPAALGLALVAFTADAHAADEPQRARLVYALDTSALGACPDAKALRKAVADRLGYDPFWEWAQRTIVVQVWQDHVRYAVRVVNIDASGRASTRQVPPDEDCRQVLAAAALAISIALDVAAPPSPGPAREPESPPPTAAEPAANTRPAPAVAPLAPAPPIPPPPRFALGGGLSTFSGIALRPSLAIDGFAELRRRAFSIGGELHVSAAAPADELQVMLASVEIAPCARLGPTFVCALGEIGWVEAWSLGVASGSTDGAPFVAFGGRGGVEVPLSLQAFARLESDLLIEAYGPRFAVPEQSYQTGGMTFKTPRTSAAPSIVGGALSLGIGVYFR